MNRTWSKMLITYVLLAILIFGGSGFFVFQEVEASDLNGGPDQYNIGAGIYDITGPAAEVGMMGYAMMDQITSGIHTRLWSRAFVVEDTASGNRVVFVSVDLGIMTQGVKQQVIEKLQAKYGELYKDDNVIISATHTHSGPGGYSHYALYNITVKGFIKENYDTIVNGIYQSIALAHTNMEPGYIKVNMGELTDVTVNRSAVAYNNNPEEERADYEHDVDTTMTVLSLENLAGEQIGIIDWFPIHGTSMGNDNTLISGDNKGYASYLYEQDQGTDYQNNKTFVAAFAQSNEGDSSPNIYDGGRTGYGGEDDFLSTEYAGSRQYEKAKELVGSAAEYISGPVNYVHKYVDFSNVTVGPEFTDGVERKTAPAALGFSFATGAEDGPSGISLFYEGMTSDQYTINSKNTVACLLKSIDWIPGLGNVSGTKYPGLWAEHGTKPILFATSQTTPYPWTPEVLPIQIVQIGQLKILAVPAEFTTMSGRRLVAAVQEVFQEEDDIYVIAGLSNAYADYVTTKEEYDLQQYEGASTIFGPWTLSAYLQEFTDIAQAMKNGTVVVSAAQPRDLRNKQINFQTGVVLDNLPIGKNFGDIVKNVNPSYTGGEVASVTFWGGHPKNDLKIGSTYLEVQQLVGEEWVVIARDWDWETKYIWKRIDPVWGSSQVTIEWDIPEDQEAGTYRLIHYGNYLYGWDRKVYPYTGTSAAFTVN